MNNETPPFPGAVRPDYTSNPITIPASFLTTPPSQPPTLHPVDFAAHNLPEYASAVAFTITDVLSPEECMQLIHLAEASVRRRSSSSSEESPWQPARVTVFDGWEVLAPDYRLCDRIIWDQKEVADRILERCLLADGVRERLATVDVREERPLKMHSLNERLRFLKYTANQYFKPHTDGGTSIVRNGKPMQTIYTMHLYLNDSAAATGDGSGDSGLTGGATSFMSQDDKRRMDINPRAGTVLIFQHAGLCHEGAEVKTGVKYTMRSEIFYE